MNAILSALANGLVLSALLAAVVWVALRLLKRNFNAATRYAIWWIALLATVALPAFYLTAGNQRRIEPAGTSYGTTDILAMRSGMSSSNSASAMRQPAPTKPSWLPGIPIRVPPSPWTERFGELWALISLLLLARLAAGFTALHFQKKYAREASLELRESMERCLIGRGIKRRVRVALVPEGNSPMLAGVFRPCVLIPERLLSELDHAELEQILLHEVTHAARYDDWALLLQRVIQAVFVFYPVVHWVARQINLEQEAACDADVISVTGDARAYARCLTHVAELSLGYWKSPLAAAIADEKSYLTRRILMLLDKNRHRGTRLLTIRLTLAATVVCLLAVLAATTPAFFVSAQSPSAPAATRAPGAPLPSFEVASIKPDRSAQPVSKIELPSGRFTVSSATAGFLIMFAYNVKPFQISGMPKWTHSQIFDVDAKEDPATAQKLANMLPEERIDQVRLMLQSLLADRFKLKIRHTTTQAPMFSLAVAKAGILHETQGCGTTRSHYPPTGQPGQWPAPSCMAFNYRGHIAGLDMPISMLITDLSIDIGRQVSDKTGLTANYDIILNWTPDPGSVGPSPFGTSFPQPEPNGPTLEDALQDQLGLKLASTMGPVDLLVVDHIEEPSPN
jgi:uncharacterized protein (TIGR03435 family)